MEEQQKNKTHKQKTVGNKAAKKDELRKKRAGIDLEPNRGNNVRAFQGPSAGSHKAQKFFRSIEKKEVALHVPTMDKTLRHVVAEPPLLVAVVGPPGVGKTSLIRSMVKFYSGRNLTAVRGPVTVVAGRSRRITFLECLNTLPAMCDVAKVADLVLLMVDGSFGFEMETFEFLNIAQVHGFPKMFGVVSHLDQLRTGKALKKRKKFLRHRFWHEVAAGAKLLCLSPMIRGMYRPNDVLNLHRLLITVEPKIQAWRNTHSCVLVDRVEDITDPDVLAQDPNHNRTVAFYGYARGKPMKAGQMVHVPGLGDYHLSHLSYQDDPCQLDKFIGVNKEGGNHRMRHLSAKQKKLYAPYCDVGGISYDDDAIYIQEDAEKGEISRSGDGVRLLRALQQAEPMDAAKTRVGLMRRPVYFRDEDTMELEMDDVPVPRDHSDEDDEDDDEYDENNALVLEGRWEDPTASRTSGPKPDLSDFGAPNGAENGEEREEEEDEDGALQNGLLPRLRNDVDSIRVNVVRHAWSGEDTLVSLLKDLCVTGNWNSGDGDDGEGTAGSDDEEDELGSKGYDSNDEDFEMEARGEKKLTRYKESRDDGDDDNDEEEGEDENGGEQLSALTLRPLTSAAPQKMNALASIGYGSNPAASNAFTALSGGGKKKGGSRHHDALDFFGLGGGGELSHPPHHPGKEGEGEGGYNILDEDEEGEEGGETADGSSMNKSGLSGDAEMDHLVSSFLARGSGPAASSSFAAPTAMKNGLQGEDGIQFFDPATQYTANTEEIGEGCVSASSRRRRPTKGEMDAAAEAAESNLVQQGNPLSEEQERLLQKKMAKKRAFDDHYDTGDAEGDSKNTTFSYYHQLNRKLEEKKAQVKEALDDVGDDVDKKIQLVGYFSGLYLRFVITDVPVEFIQHFDPATPLFAGGVNAGEDEFRIVHARLMRHRWFPKLLKAQDPMLLSMGWRRFQTQPIFATEDPNGRCRYLKYSPMHMHCMATFYAPVAPPNTGFLAIPVKNQRLSNFRISCTGYTIGNDVTTSVVKKLKLTGTPAKVEKTTVFIKGMFSSDIEAAKFVGAKVKAVSGIRGIIKSVMKGKQGLVRATFEDKLFPSDIIFIRAWKSVEPPKYCSMQRNLVDPEWAGMRTMRELRWDYGVPLPSNTDSEYREIKRRHRVAEVGERGDSQRVMVSRSTRMQLPYEMKEEFVPLPTTSAAQERIQAAVTLAPEPREQRRRALLDTFEDRADEMNAKKDAARKRARERAEKEAAREEEKYLAGLKKAKKETARMKEFRTQHKSRAK